MLNNSISEKCGKPVIMSTGIFGILSFVNAGF